MHQHSGEGYFYAFSFFRTLVTMNSVQAVISGVGELIGRVLCGWLAVHSLGYFGICIANPIAWGLALLYCVFPRPCRVLRKTISRPLMQNSTLITVRYSTAPEVTAGSASPRTRPTAQPLTKKSTTQAAAQ